MIFTEIPCSLLVDWSHQGHHVRVCVAGSGTHLRDTGLSLAVVGGKMLVHGNMPQVSLKGRKLVFEEKAKLTLTRQHVVNKPTWCLGT